MQEMEQATSLNSASDSRRDLEAEKLPHMKDLG